MHDPLLEQDLEKLLAQLREAPKTQGELVRALRLRSARIGNLLEVLRQKGVIHTTRCIADERGRTVNLWEIRTTASSAESGTFSS
jgi:DNA-binding MarR family transcriptional regulator